MCRPTVKWQSQNVNSEQSRTPVLSSTPQVRLKVTLSQEHPQLLAAAPTDSKSQHWAVPKTMGFRDVTNSYCIPLQPSLQYQHYIQAQKVSIYITQKASLAFSAPEVSLWCPASPSTGRLCLRSSYIWKADDNWAPRQLVEGTDHDQER